LSRQYVVKLEHQHVREITQEVDKPSAAGGKIWAGKQSTNEETLEYGDSYEDGEEEQDSRRI